ncbi:MAG: CopM family metallochaperone [Candidatus Wenzhouxiangella sp. M2_3B_020]
MALKAGFYYEQAYGAASERMHSEMDIAYSDNPEADFARGMIGHRQGAIDMARVVLEFGDDPELKKLAQDVNEAQESEVQFLQD